MSRLTIEQRAAMIQSARGRVSEAQLAEMDAIIDRLDERMNSRFTFRVIAVKGVLRIEAIKLRPYRRT